MRGVCIAVCASFILLGCHGKSAMEHTQATSTLKPVDTEHEPGLLEQYRFGMFSIGGWVNQKMGQRFQPVQAQDEQAAIVYLYRPDSKWNRQEIVASSLFINSERIPSLLNNHYYWVELPAGTYRISTSRPVGVQHFQKPKYLDFIVQAGQSYFIKYDEENLSTRREVSGPLIMVPEKTGLNEIAYTQLKSESYNFVALDQKSGKLRKKAQKLKPAKYDPAEDVQLTKPFKIWNPLTW
ncbi:DUF2846 domain-containing protein [Acinetobacter sp. ANC 4216]|uniref:DUF2846 domain-containing protein n=1 Tax=Acinetobacter sp. ANC 4216 TaxID=2529840 RepID=UPI00103E4C51|nr:DUF2846 domain-containing protein [Acinetobacter sp. ANC 4216]TCB70304.1 DUF2846 domain-containing protein [Acinetobacter sp. ANC 4216]